MSSTACGGYSLTWMRDKAGHTNHRKPLLHGKGRSDITATASLFYWERAAAPFGKNRLLVGNSLTCSQGTYQPDRLKLIT